MPIFVKDPNNIVLVGRLEGGVQKTSFEVRDNKTFCNWSLIRLLSGDMYISASRHFDDLYDNLLKKLLIYSHNIYVIIF